MNTQLRTVTVIGKIALSLYDTACRVMVMSLGRRGLRDTRRPLASSIEQFSVRSQEIIQETMRAQKSVLRYGADMTRTAEAETVDSILRRRVIERREALGLEQRPLSRAIGLSDNALGQWERGEIKDLKAPFLPALARELQTTVAWLLGIDDDATRVVTDALARERAAMEALDVANRLSAGLSEVMVLADIAKKREVLAAIEIIMADDCDENFTASARSSPSKSRG